MSRLHRCAPCPNCTTLHRAGASRLLLPSSPHQAVNASGMVTGQRQQPGDCLPGNDRGSPATAEPQQPPSPFDSASGGAERMGRGGVSQEARSPALEGTGKVGPGEQSPVRARGWAAARCWVALEAQTWNCPWSEVKPGGVQLLGWGIPGTASSRLGAPGVLQAEASKRGGRASRTTGYERAAQQHPEPRKESLPGASRPLQRLPASPTESSVQWQLQAHTHLPPHWMLL